MTKLKNPATRSRTPKRDRVLLVRICPRCGSDPVAFDEKIGCKYCDFCGKEDIFVYGNPYPLLAHEWNAAVEKYIFESTVSLLRDVDIKKKPNAKVKVKAKAKSRRGRCYA